MIDGRYKAGGFHDSISTLSSVFSFGSFRQAAGTAFSRMGWPGARGHLHRYMKLGVRSTPTVSHAHDETVFRFLLANEYRRSERSRQSFHLLLLYFAGPGEDVAWMDWRAKNRLLLALSGVVRETDYIGWYRDDHVIGGVLTTLGDPSTREACDRIEGRLIDGVGGELESSESYRLRLRFFHSQDLRGVDSPDYVLRLV